MPRPETAVLGREAACAPIQKRHTKPIHCGKRYGRLTTPGGAVQKVLAKKKMTLAMRHLSWEQSYVSLTGFMGAVWWC
jgi:hypothetical protein